MTLRLKGERDDEILDADDAGTPRAPDEITWDDAFADNPEPGDGDGYERDEAEHGSGLLLRGLGIAAAAFVPTFLAVFLGLPYLLGSPAPTSDRPALVATAPLTSGSELAPTETLQSGAGDRGSEPAVAPPTASVEPVAPALTLPPAAPRAAKSPPRPALEARPEPEARRPGEWTPAAAFADREAAGRLASSIRNQGRAAEIRPDGSSEQPWVVWVLHETPGPKTRR